MSSKIKIIMEKHGIKYFQKKCPKNPTWDHIISIRAGNGCDMQKVIDDLSEVFHEVMYFPAEAKIGTFMEIEN